MAVQYIFDVPDIWINVAQHINDYRTLRMISYLNKCIYKYFRNYRKRILPDFINFKFTKRIHVFFCFLFQLLLN